MKQQMLLSITLAAYCLAGTAMAQTCKTNISPSTDASQFIDLNEGYVLDVKTGLMWSKCVFGQNYVDGKCLGAPTSFNDWASALHSTIDINEHQLAGFDDWRLPNIKELASLVEYQCHSPAIRLSVFPETPSAGFWTNTPNPEFEQLGPIVRKGRIIDFSFGLDVLPQSNPQIYVRHVREAGI